MQYKGNLIGIRSPATTFGFGQNIIPKKKLLVELNMSEQKATQEQFVALYPSLVYGITNYLSVYIAIPTVPKFELNGISARGIGNITTQLEYVWYTHQTPDYQAQATLVANLTFPTANIDGASFTVKDTIRAYDALSIFIGSTASYLSDEWYFYIAPGYVFNTTSHSSITLETSDMICTATTTKKDGDILYYQWGIGHAIQTPSHASLMCALEFNGIYSKKNKINGLRQPNTGGNIIFAGPTLCITEKRYQLQMGIQLPILQKVNGNQGTQRYRTMVIASMRF